jgi:8-oxo-dGTP pyrophosphatase MutT (NUDIX family)
MWDLPGGKPLHGETLFQTLQREIQEETHINLEKATLFLNQSHLIEYQEQETLISLHHICLIFKALQFNDSNLKTDIMNEDVEGCAWIEKARLSQLPLSRVVLSIL